MAHQTSLNREGNTQNGVAGSDSLWVSLGDLGGSVATLAELQVSLAYHESRDMLRRAALPAGWVVAASILALGSVPVALLGVSELLVSALGVSRVRALLMTGGTGLAIAALVLTFALPRLAACVESLRNSRDELKRNVAFIRTAMSQSGRRVR